MRTHRSRATLLLGPVLAAVLGPACSLFVDLGPLSNGEGGAGGGSGGAGTTGGQGGQGGMDVTTSTGAGGGVLTFRDDEEPGEFGAGTYMGTKWSSDGTLTLGDLGVGQFLSRVFDAGAPANWLTLGWAPLGPYGKALPDGGMAESYTKGNVDMTGNILLLHLDGTGLIEPGEKLADSSGLGYSATAVGAPFSYDTGGKFGQAIDDGPDGYVYVNTNTSPELEFGQEDFTWSIWVKGTEDCAGNKVHLGLDDGTGDTPHLWLGCTPSTSTGCPAGAAGGRAGGTFKANHQTGETNGVCGTTRINDGQWHHLAVVKSGQSNVLITLYVDGVAESVKSTTWASPIVYSTYPELAVGAFSEGTYPAIGQFDEVAIWKRALGPSEIEAVFHRGGLHLAFQVRGCSLPDCSDSPPFVGPGGDSTAAYTAPPGPDPWAQVSLDALSPDGSKPTQYFQYRVIFASDAMPVAPELTAVEITAQPE